MKRTICAALVLAMVLSISPTVFAAGTAGVSSSGGTGETVIEVTGEATMFSASVPTVLPVSVSSDGMVTTATDVQIVNDATGPIKITGISVSQGGGWTLAAWDGEAYDGMDIGKAEYAMSFFGNGVAADGTCSVESIASIGGGGVLTIKYDARVPMQKVDMNAANIGHVTFTLGWDEYVPVCADTAVLYADGTMVFQHGAEPLSGHGDVVGTYSGVDKIHVPRADYMPWFDTRGSILSVEFAAPISPVSTAHWFEVCANMTTIENIGQLNTSGVTDMRGMFSQCRGLESLDVSGLDTSNVTDMYEMFANNKLLTTLDVSNFDTSNAVNMTAMFSCCAGLGELDVSGFDTSCVTDMHSMFNECSSLTELNLHNFDTSSVTNMSGMFGLCGNLAAIDITGFDTSKVTDMSFMFRYDTSLTDLDLSNFDTSGVTDMWCMFKGCSNLVSLDLSSFDTSKARMKDMFADCSNLSSIKVGSGWKWNYDHRLRDVPWYDAVTGIRYTSTTIPDGAGHYVTTPPTV